MLRKSLLTMLVGAMLGIAVIVPKAVLAFGPPPLPGGPPPGLAGPPSGLGLGGLPAGPGLGDLPLGPRFGGLLVTLDQGVLLSASATAVFRATGVASKFALQVAPAALSYRYSGRYGYGHDWRYGRRVPYGTYGYETADSDSGCYYSYGYGLHRRVVVCSQD